MKIRSKKDASSKTHLFEDLILLDFVLKALMIWASFLKVNDLGF